MGFACTAGEASATVKGNTSIENETAIAKANGKPAPKPGDTAAAYVDNEMNPARLAGLKPAPDLTDSLIEEARKRMAMQLMTQSDRKASMQNGTYSYGSYSLLK